jgi:nitric oxide synthase oxygenase domain/subunit
MIWVFTKRLHIYQIAILRLDKGYGNNNIGTTVVESVNTNMQKLGYTLDRTNPDLLVLLSTSTDLDTNNKRTCLCNLIIMDVHTVWAILSKLLL